MKSFSEFIMSLFGKSINDTFGEFKPFCTYGWDTKILYLVARDCSYLEVFIDEYLTIIYDAHTKEVVGFSISIDSVSLRDIEPRLLRNQYLYRAYLHFSKEWYEDSMYLLHDIILMYINDCSIDNFEKNEIRSLCYKVRGVEHLNYAHY